MYLLFSLLLHCCHPSSRIDFDWTGFPNLHRVDKHGEMCLALANTGRKGAVQGLAGLGRWGRVLLPKAVGWDSRKLWGISATLHPFPCSLGTLLLAAAAECRSTKQQWVGRTKNHSDLFFLSQAIWAPNYLLQVAAQGSFLLFFCGESALHWPYPVDRWWHGDTPLQLCWQPRMGNNISLLFHLRLISLYGGGKMYLLSFWTSPAPSLWV